MGKGRKENGKIALEILGDNWIDLVFADINMPVMGGVEMIDKMSEDGLLKTVPVIIVSSLTRRGGDLALEALEAGAIEVMCKPGPSYSVGDLSIELVDKIKAAAGVKVEKRTTPDVQKSAKKRAVLSMTRTTNKIVAIGASTGGTRAIERILTSLPANSPGVMIVQHMPEHFTRSFAERLNECSAMHVKEAEGLKEMQDAGAKTVAQNEKSSIVFGMPREAIKLGAVDHIVSLDNIPKKILDLAAMG